MNAQTSKAPSRLHSLWITLEAAEVLDLKRIGQDREASDALTYFHEVLLPRMRAAARQRGLALDLLDEMENDERLSR